MLPLNESSKLLNQSPIRSISTACYEMGGINLGQGICDLATPDLLKTEAWHAIQADKNKYAPCEGILPLREAIAKKMASFNNIKADPKNQILISHGSTGAFISAIATLFSRGDGIVLFEPFYGYHRGILEFFDMEVLPVDIRMSDYQIDWDTLEKHFKAAKPKGLVVCSPCNPSGKVFTDAELERIGQLCKKHGTWIITDEIYEYITYPGHKHRSIASMQDFFDNTITISGFSKTYNMTGWRLGYACGPAYAIEKMTLCHDLFYVCPPTPLQHGTIKAPSFNPEYYETMRKDFLKKRDLIVNTLQEIGFSCTLPQGAYYILADFSKLKIPEPDFAMYLLNHAKVASVLGRAFFKDPSRGKNLARFCFAVDQHLLDQALTNIRRLFS